MIQTTNYIARKFGVKSGMPGFIGRKLCPNLVFIKPNYPKYREISEKFKNVLRCYDTKLESCGLDEANLDLTEYL
jgi:DNA polymerase kappa